jgi:methylglyoxal synthase
MNIALMAHDGKKELMVQFCIAYCGILSEHTIIATNTTGKLVSEATGLPIALYMGEAQGGVQQIGARISYNEIDLVMFFSDPTHPELAAPVNEIARLCDMHNVPFATNVATAEVLVQGLRRGDFAWRDIVNPKNRKK